MKTKASYNTKSFDAVKFMRQQRDRISKDTMDLSPDDVVKYFKTKTNKDK